MTDKERFVELLRSNIERDGVERLIKALDETDFYTAPASTRFHDSEPGGLVKHSLNVYDWFRFDNPDLSANGMEMVTIITLLHDICKIGFYKVSSRNVKDENGKWIQVPYYEVEDQLPLGHGDKSVIMLMEFMKLTTEEMMAIRWHMGGFVPSTEYNTLGKAFESYPVALLMHIADMKATYIGECK